MQIRFCKLFDKHNSKESQRNIQRYQVTKLLIKCCEKN